MSRDAIADAYEKAERRLARWGFILSGAAERLHMPKDRETSVARVVRQRRIFEHNFRTFDAEIRRLEKKLKAKKRPPRMLCLGCEREFQVARFCPHCGRDALTADGKPSMMRSKLPALQLPADVIEIEKIVVALPRWMRRTLRDAFIRGKADHIAANEHKMREQEYAQRRRCAVQRVADILFRR